jgi:hypothetical protein
MNTRRRIIVSLGLGIIALLVGGAVLWVGIYPDHVEYFASGPMFETVSGLTTASQAVVRARVVEVGKSYRMPMDAPVVVVSPPPDGTKKGTAPSAPIPTSGRHTDPGLLKTDFTIEVLQTVKASKDYTGQRLTVTQLGGTDEHGRSVVVEDDPLLKVGDQEIMFLQQDPRSGKFFTTGGGQGRFGVNDRGTVTARDQESLVGRAHHGKRVEVLTDAVKVVK